MNSITHLNNKRNVDMFDVISIFFLISIFTLFTSLSLEIVFLGFISLSLHIWMFWSLRKHWNHLCNNHCFHVKEQWVFYFQIEQKLINKTKSIDFKEQFLGFYLFLNNFCLFCRIFYLITIEKENVPPFLFS